MKYRNDFVTNSSSSSFIVVFNNKADKEKHYREMKEKYPQYCDQVFNDIQKYRKTYKEILDYLDLYASYFVIESLRRETDLFETKPMRYFQTDEFKSMVEKKAKQLIEDFKNSVNHRGQFSYVTYEDHIFPELERLMYTMPFVFKIVNRHGS